MGNKGILTAFAVALLVYSGWRTWDYMSRYMLQDVSITEGMLIGIVFLVVTELGFLFWLHIGQPNATTDRQETVATIMVYTDLIGAMIIGLADILAHNKLYTFNTSAIDPILLLTPWVLIVANLFGYTMYYSNDTERQVERENRRLKHEENRAEIATRRHALEELERNREALAKTLAPLYINDIRDRITGRTANKFMRQADKAAKIDVKISEPERLVASTNGDEVEEVVVNGRKGNPTKRQ